MPFHMTVLGIYLGNEFSPLPRDHMELFGEAICEKVAEAAGMRSVEIPRFIMALSQGV